MQGWMLRLRVIFSIVGVIHKTLHSYKLCLVRAIQLTSTAWGPDETQTERALVKVKFVCIIPERKSELVQAATVSCHHRFAC